MATRNYWAVFGSGSPATTSGLSPTFISFITSTGAAGTAPSISEPGSKGLYLFAYDASATMIAFVLDGATTGLATTDRYISGVLDPYDTFGVTLNAIGTTLIAQGSTITAIGTTGIAQGATIVAMGNTLAAMGVTQIFNSLLITQLGSTAVAMGNTVAAMGVTQIYNSLLITQMGSSLVAAGNTLAGLNTNIGTTADVYGSSSADPTSVFGFLKRAQELAEGNNTYTKSTGVLTMFSRSSATLLATKTISDTSALTTKT